VVVIGCVTLLLMNVLKLTQQEFIDLPWSEKKRQRIKEIIDCSDFLVLAANHRNNDLKLFAFLEIPESFDDDTVGLFYLPEISLKGLSKTQKAMRLVLKKGYSVNKASKLVGVNHSAVFRAIKRRRDKTVCSSCGQVVRDGFALSQT